jgi:protein-S-isoprenylcysteine O-methyltransferase Ste14
MSVPPEHLVTTGPYRYTRNPMYLGHLIFMLGLALSFASWPAAALLGFHVPWFNDRAREDEAQLRTLFGPAYEAYAARVKRWIPGIL